MNKTLLTGLAILLIAGLLTWAATGPGQLFNSPTAALAGDNTTDPDNEDTGKQGSAEPQQDEEESGVDNKTGKSDDILADAKDKLTPEQYNVCVMGGTERPFENKYYNHKEDGSYHCVVCDAPLFSSETKYDSGSGWPAFYDAVDRGTIREIRDESHGMVRTEVRCGECDAHLGHLFNDGPSPTGMRYCINSASLEFAPAEEPAADSTDS